MSSRLLFFPIFWWFRIITRTISQVLIYTGAAIRAIHGVLIVWEFWSRNFQIVLDKESWVGLAINPVTGITYVFDMKGGRIHEIEVSEEAAPQLVQDNANDTVQDKRTDDQSEDR